MSSKGKKITVSLLYKLKLLDCEKVFKEGFDPGVLVMQEADWKVTEEQMKSNMFLMGINDQEEEFLKEHVGVEIVQLSPEPETPGNRQEAGRYRELMREMGEMRGEGGREKALTQIEEALKDYHRALDRREHGGVAQDKMVHKVEEILAMPWFQGVSEDYESDDKC